MGRTNIEVMQVDIKIQKCSSLRIPFFAVVWGSVVLESLTLAEKETEPACYSIDSSLTLHCEHLGGLAGLVNPEGKLLFSSVAMAR